MRKLQTTLLSIATCLLTFGTPHAEDFALGDLRITNPYTRAMASNAPVGASYMTITNVGKTDDQLLSAQSDRAGEVQIHEMKVQNDVMVMREMPKGLIIPAGKTVELKPGGYHVMYLKVPVPFKQGETVRTTLTFEKAGNITLDVPVGGLAGEKPAAMKMPDTQPAQ
ncbi:copper(I)-binding protein [Neorhizobium sp. 2083]|uniref:copper chaperone PCu(A)C n=1 Tax=Neorhizobium sp. 2083 TaxID=2817762 RepID=UPI00285E3137|nr:copper chaperone PCu(A)C [Neorhizobium sp. 2083]MDR6820980.1 copper(I)-binding protein [Neorhizobium sp. 2083]